MLNTELTPRINALIDHGQLAREGDLELGDFLDELAASVCVRELSRAQAQALAEMLGLPVGASWSKFAAVN